MCLSEYYVNICAQCTPNCFLNQSQERRGKHKKQSVLTFKFSLSLMSLLTTCMTSSSMSSSFVTESWSLPLSSFFPARLMEAVISLVWRKERLFYDPLCMCLLLAVLLKVKLGAHAAHLHHSGSSACRRPEPTNPRHSANIAPEVGVVYQRQVSPSMYLLINPIMKGEWLCRLVTDCLGWESNLRANQQF